MTRDAAPRSRARDVVWFATGMLLPVPWLVAHAFDGLGLSSEFTALLAGSAILG